MLTNSVKLIGRIAHDIEIRKTVSGTSVISNSLAVDRRKKNGEDQGADFLNIVVWSHGADYLGQYARKGDMIAVDGRLSQRQYDNQDGRKVNVIEVICDEVKILQQANNRPLAGSSVNSYGYQRQAQPNVQPANSGYESMGWTNVQPPTDADAPTIDSDDLPF